MSYSPLSPPHSNRILSCLCNGKTKKLLFYLGLKILIVGLLFHHGSGKDKKPIKYSYVEERTRLFVETTNKTCLLPNPDLFLIPSIDLPRCSQSTEDWLWVTVNGDILPREGWEAAYCKKRRNREDPWEKLRFGERISDIIEVKCTDGGRKWQNCLWKLTPKESVKRELDSSTGKKDNLLIFELSSIGKEEFRQKFRSTIIWLKNHRSYTELRNVHASSENYYIDGMFNENAKSSSFSEATHATLIIDRENSRNLSQFAHHYGFFRYPDESSCLQSDGQHTKSLTILTDFLSSYRDSPYFASVHLSLTKSSDTAAIDNSLSSWFDQNRHLLESTSIVITAGGSPYLSSSTSHLDLLDSRLPFVAISPSSSSSSQLEKKTQKSPILSLIPSSEIFGSNLLKCEYRSMNCREGGIGEDYCMCVEERESLNSPNDIQEVIEIVNSIVTYMNEKTLKYRFLCDVLSLDEILDATKMSISPSALRLPIHGKDDRYFIEEAFTQYKIRFRTKQGRKVFDATVAYFSAERTVEIDEGSLQLISEEKSEDCIRAYPSVIDICACKSRSIAMFSRLFLG